MGKRVKVQTEYTAEELHKRYRHTKDAVERTHWCILWQAKEGKTPHIIAKQLGYTARWVRTVIGRWDAQGEAGIRDHRHEIDVSRPLLSEQQHRELATALQEPAEDGGRWSGPKVALWMQQRLGREVAPPGKPVSHIKEVYFNEGRSSSSIQMLKPFPPACLRITIFLWV